MNPALLALLVAASILQGWGSPVIHPAGEEHMFTKGQPVHFYCTGNHSVQWLGSTSWKKKYVSGTVTNSSFRTLKAVPGDTGTYRCVYTNRTFAGEASVHIYVKDPSKPWYVGRSGVTADKGMDVLFPCLTTDPAVTHVSLVQDGKGPVPAEATSFSPQQGITLHKVQTDQEGWYRCEGITNGVTTQSDKIELSVNVPADPPTVIIETEGYLRIPGEEFKITCKATNTVPVSVKWKHASNNAKFMKPNSHFSNGKWSDESVLQISKVETTDSGDFTCVALSDDKTTNVSTTLQVLDRGYVRLDTPGMDRSLERTLAEETLLQVQIEAYPRLLNWSWTHQRTDSLDKSSLGKLLDLKNSRYESSLTLHRPKADESGLYTFFAANSEASNSITFSVHDPPSASASLFSFNNSKELRCVASGYPTPNISWYWCSGWKESCDEEEMWPLEGANTEVSFGKAVGTLILTEIEQNATYGCTASNVVGFTRDTVKIQLAERVREQRVQHQLFSPVLATLAGMTTLFLLLLILLLYKYKQKPKYETRWQIIDGREGNNYIFIDPTQLPYNEKLEFPRSNLTFGKTLGAGAFGKVLEATAHGLGKEDATVKVAVKMLKPSAHTEEKEALMSELKIMSHLGQHENIVNLLGACTSGGPILVITEYCEQGDLLNFLRKNGESLIVKDLVTEAGLKGVSDYKNISLDKKYTRSDSGFSSQCRESYIEMRPVRSDSTSKQGSALTEGEEEREDTKPLTLFDLLSFSSQVAQGMAFLASKNCIHRDVAARNILVTDGRIAKICDFGLARDIMNDSNYVIKGNARLPVKWMAPESIFDCIYTVQSDVWSYGILLWEIFSLGMSPYPGIVVDRKFYKLVKQGYQMARPDFAPLEIYEIMRACWDLESTHRPTFQQISLFIQEQIGREVQEYANLPCQAEVDNDPDCGSPTCDKECCEQAQVDQPLLRGNNYQFC